MCSYATIYHSRNYFVSIHRPVLGLTSIPEGIDAAKLHNILRLYKQNQSFNKTLTFMRQVNLYVASLPEVGGCTTARYQGIAESREEFITMCQEAGYDLDGLDIVEEKRNVRNEMRQPCRKQVSEW